MCSLYKGIKKGREKCVSFSIYKEYNKTMGKGGKSCGKVCSSLYIEYIIKRTCGKGKKVAGKGKCGKEYSSFLYIDIVYNRDKEKKRKVEKGGAKVCSLYI